MTCQAWTSPGEESGWKGGHVDQHIIIGIILTGRESTHLGYSQ